MTIEPFDPPSRLRIVPLPDLLPPPSFDDTSSSDDRPEVRLVTANPHQAIDDIADLLHLDRSLYVRGKELVTIVGALAPREDDRAPVAESTPLIVPVEPATLTERLTRHIRLTRRKPLSKTQQAVVDAGGRGPTVEWVPALPPPGVIGGVLARRQWPLRHLTSVSETPVLRPDGTLLQLPGYDRSTGYVYRPSADYPEIPIAPSRDQARAALAELAEVFVDFPYVDDAARMVPIAAILTVLARSAIVGSCPAFLLDATTRGSGKTLQADAVSAVSLGRSAARKSYPVEEEELGKVLASYAQAGARLILFDNVTREFGGGEIDQAITARDTVEIRILGRTEMKRLPWAAVLLASGNNIVLSEDTVRRVLIARLESPAENPEDRVGFRHPHLFDWIIAERPRLVAAALTVLVAFASRGGHRNDDKAWGSFEAWSRLVPGAIVYAGGADPMLARPSIEQHASDSSRALVTVLDMLPRLCPGRGLTTREIVHLLYPAKTADAERTLDGFDDLRDAIEAWTLPKPGQPPSLQLLGKRLRSNVGRCIGGRRLVRDQANDARQTVRWRVQ
ncbi:MAG TPA: hypothetical protein VNJ04_04920 [Gemmatimonadaceae bacterium]|nr:hypothetical protein [Gemmatimonadaceae bacterium]